MSKVVKGVYPVIVLVGLCAQAAAQSSDTVTINLAGLVEEVCSVSVEGENVSDATYTGTTDEQESYGDDTVSIQFSFEGDSNGNVGDIQEGSVIVPFEVYCNDSFDITFQATGGQLENTGFNTAPNNFSRALPIAVAVDVPGVNGSSTSGSTTGLDPLQGVGTVEISWSDQSNLLAGWYEGTIEVAFTPDGTAATSSFFTQ